MAPPKVAPSELWAERAEAHPGVRRGNSRFGGRTAFFVGPCEIAHLHGPAEVDVRLTRSVIRRHRPEFVADERVALRSGPSEWVTLAVRSRRDIPWALALFEEAWRAAQ